MSLYYTNLARGCLPLTHQLNVLHKAPSVPQNGLTVSKAVNGFNATLE